MTVDKNGHYVCSCGQWFDHKLLYEAHAKYCEKERRANMTPEQKRRMEEDFADDAYQFKRIGIGILIMLVAVIGFIYNIALGKIDADLTYLWAILFFIGAGVAVGFTNLIFGAIGGLFEGMSESANLHDIAKGISITQTNVEARNNLLNKDIFGQSKK